MSDDAKGFFKENKGSGGAPSFKFNGINSGVRGKVVDQYRTFVTKFNSTEPKLDKNGNEQPQLNVTLQTDLSNWEKVAKVPVYPEDHERKGQEIPASEDTGLRRIYVKHRMINAVGAALKAAGVEDMETGGELAVKQTGEQDTGQANPLPLYEARYTPPAKTDGFFAEASTDKPAAQDPFQGSNSQDDSPPF